MFGSGDRKITVSRDLHERLERAAKVAGYSSTEEFVQHILETAAPAAAGTESEDEVRKRLQGLGYLG